MGYLGHYDTKTKKQQSLKEHLEHVAGLAARFAAVFGAEELGALAGRYHDLGKYSVQFQAYLRGERSSGGDHSTGGAQVLFRRKSPLLLLAAWAIAGHHGGLPDFGGDFDDAGSATFCSRMRKELPDFSAWKAEEEAPVPPDAVPSFLQPLDIYRMVRCKMKLNS